MNVEFSEKEIIDIRQGLIIAMKQLDAGNSADRILANRLEIHESKLSNLNPSDQPENDLDKLKSENIKLKIKADNWDNLDEKIAFYYREDFDQGDENGDLLDIGELAARAFGWL